MLITRTPVRLSFAGGGTDLPAYYERYGGAVLSTAINKYFYTVLTERADATIQVISADLKAIRSVQDLDGVDPQAEELAIPLQVLKELGCSRGVNLFLASEIPPGTGLGSSASVCVNVLKAVATWLGRPMSKHELAEAAFTIATRRLGKPVGKQDEYGAAFGGLKLIRFERDGIVDVQPLEMPGDALDRLEGSLMLFFTGSARDSTTILSEQNSASSRGDVQVTRALHDIKDLVGATAAVLERGDLDAFGELLHEGWKHKKKVSSRISNPYIDRLYELARDGGAGGGKITGAGGGGFLLLYCAPAHQAAVRSLLEAEGARQMYFRFDLHGAAIVHDDPFYDTSGRGGTCWRFVSLEAAA
jgi:D-glycero-alpha-D-manno-heptose-7-phosphate kinase